MRHHFITGAGGVRLHACEAGRPEGPAIVFLHGWAQSHLAWLMQMRDEALVERFRLVAVDLRGHGMSGAPRGAEHYTDNAPWAGDVDAVIRELELERPLLAGWSYGGSVICDYLSMHGARAISGVNLIAPAVLFTKGQPGRWYGPGLLDNAAGGRSADMAESIAAMRGLLHACFVRPVPEDYFEIQLAASMLSRPDVRGAMVRKRLAYEAMFAGLEVPVLLSHGSEDRVVLPDVSKTVAGMIPSARLSLYEDAGHCPYAEAPERFNAELMDFAANCQA